jgi:hypothetical protein
MALNHPRHSLDIERKPFNCMYRQVDRQTDSGKSNGWTHGQFENNKLI